MGSGRHQITGFFGINFEALPLFDSSIGVWLTLGPMAVVIAMLSCFFRRTRHPGCGHR